MRRQIAILLIFPMTFLLFGADPGPVVSIYDEFDGGLFGRSVHRGVVVSVKKSAFARSESFDVKNDGDNGYLTAVVMSEKTGQKLLADGYGLPYKIVNNKKIFTFNKDGLDISFSIEKANERLIRMVSEFYSDDETWHDPLVDHYRKNYVIRIFRAENVFDSWSDDISYSEAMIAATLLGDTDQWLWGIHDGSDILNRGY